MKGREDIARIVSEETGLSLVQSREAISVMLEAVIKELEGGESVRFSKFGVFGVKVASPTKSRNFSSGELMDVPERKVPFFKAGDVFKNRIRSS